jgi:nicotinamidase-related amidase
VISSTFSKSLPPLQKTTMAQKSHTAFLLIDNQVGFEHKTHWGPNRSNLHYEANIQTLLHAFRAHTPPVLIIHIQHLSRSPSSPLHPSSAGSAFYPSATPLPGELTITKTVNSAFIGTDLEAVLRANEIWTLCIAGLSTDHCVSTTTRMAGNLHVTDHVGEDGEVVEGDVVLVGDATAAWEKPGGRWDAETIQAVHLESLAEFARITTTEAVVKEL